MPGGRPTKYYPEICDKLVAFFNRPQTITRKKTIVTKSGEVIDIDEDIPNKFPTLERFCFENDLDTSTIVEWSNDPNKPEFSSAYQKAKMLQKDFLIDHGLSDNYPAAAFCFVAKNCTDMRDQIAIDHSGGVKIERSISLPSKKIEGANVDTQ